MYEMIRVALVVVAGALVAGCGDARDQTTPEAQQVARINRELASLRQSVDALHSRVERMEGQAAVAKPDGAGVRAAVEPVVVRLDGSAQGTPGGYTIDGRVVSQDELLAAIERDQERTRAGGVVLEASADAPYDRVVQVLDMLKEAGVERISLRTQEPDAP